MDEDQERKEAYKMTSLVIALGIAFVNKDTKGTNTTEIISDANKIYEEIINT